ncbi:MAG TPA: hypothetical protein VIX12_06875 [Candidatus Binataceae bacterium]
MARVIVITHQQDNFCNRHYLIQGFFSHWREMGHEIYLTAGTDAKISGDIAFLHVDCSVIDDAYLEYAKRFPITLNLSTRDIRKSAISRSLVRPSDGWTGPVVVKSNLNCGGMPEREHNRIAAHNREVLPHKSAKVFEQYQILDSPTMVPRRVWKNPALVVERFLPERDEHGFWLRCWVFLGDRERCNRYLGSAAIVKGSETTLSESVPVPAELREMRARLRFDYGKFDFAMHQGRPILFDANRTPGSAPNLVSMFARNAANLAAGINVFLK